MGTKQYVDDDHPGSLSQWSTRDSIESDVPETHGPCEGCGNHADLSGYSLCIVCESKQAKYRTERALQKLRDAGLL